MIAKKKKFLNIENEEVQEFRPDHRVYNQVCVAAHLRDIRLLVSDYYTNLQVIEVIEDFESADQSIFGECTQTIFDYDAEIVQGHFHWSVDVWLGREKGIELQADYMITYVGLTDYDERHVRFFVEKIGRFATYPYFRALFSYHSGESGLMLPPLPTLTDDID